MKHRLLVLALVLAFSGTAGAALIDRGGGMIYDDVLDITWLQDANYAMTSGFDADGWMTWDASVTSAAGLSFGGFDDWRLASMDVNMDDAIVDCDGASEEACRDNELGYMFYHNLMGVRGDDLTGTQGLFTNIQAIYFSGTEFATNPSLAWSMVFFEGGNQVAGNKINVGPAWAVRDGDICSPSTDADCDGLENSADNCSLAINTGQRDTDGDSIGNACDADIDGDCSVNFGDLAALKAAFAPRPYDPDADFDGDGFVNFGDLAILKSTFFNGPNPGPGPSGLPNDCDGN